MGRNPLRFHPIFILVDAYVCTYFNLYVKVYVCFMPLFINLISQRYKIKRAKSSVWELVDNYGSEILLKYLRSSFQLFGGILLSVFQ